MKLLWGIGMALCTCSLAHADSAASTAWATRLLDETGFEQEMAVGAYNTRLALPDVVEAFDRVLAKYGRTNSKALIGLARAHTALGEYDSALAAYNEASQLLPSDQSLAAEIARVRRQGRVASAVASHIPKGESVLQAEPYIDNTWAVLTAKVTLSTNITWPDITDPRLSIYQGRPDSLKLTWRSGVLGYSGHTNGEYNDIYLYIKDVTGDGRADMVIPARLIGGSWTPSHIDIFTLRSGKPAHLLGAVADDSLIMKDLNGDGRYEVMTDHAIGWNLSHAAQPRWIDTYAYRNRTYQIAEKDFPEVYNDLYKQIRTALREAPGDFELLYYLGRVYEIRRQPQSALRSYIHAERNAVKEIGAEQAEKSAYLADRATVTLRAIRARIAKLRAQGIRSR